MSSAVHSHIFLSACQGVSARKPVTPSKCDRNWMAWLWSRGFACAAQRCALQVADKAECGAPGKETASRSQWRALVWGFGIEAAFWTQLLKTTDTRLFQLFPTYMQWPAPIELVALRCHQWLGAAWFEQISFRQTDKCLRR